MYRQSLSLLLWVTQKYHQRHSNCKLGKSVRLPLPALTLLRLLRAWHLEIFSTGCPQNSKTTIKCAPIINHWLSFVSIEMPFIKYLIWDFAGGTVVKNPPANAGDTGSSPGPGRSHMPWSNKAHAPQLLSLCSRAHEPQLLRPRATTTEACVPRARAPQQREATAMRSPCTATKSSPPACRN